MQATSCTSKHFKTTSYIFVDDSSTISIANMHCDHLIEVTLFLSYEVIRYIGVIRSC